MLEKQPHNLGTLAASRVMQGRLLVLPREVWVCAGVEQVADDLQVLLNDGNLQRRLSLKAACLRINGLAIHESRHVTNAVEEGG